MILLAATCVAATSVAAAPAQAGQVIFDTPAVDGNFYKAPSEVPDFAFTVIGSVSATQCGYERVTPSPVSFFSGDCLGSPGTGPQPGAGYGPGFEPYTWNVRPQLGIDGRYRVFGSALLNPEGLTEFSRSFTLDTTLPQVAVSAPVGFTADRTPDVSFSVVDANPDVTRCGIDASGPGDNVNLSICPQSSLTLPALPDGQHTFWAVHTDRAGNTQSSTRSFSVDTLAPDISINGVESGQVLRQTSLDLAVTASDAGSGVGSLLCSWDGRAASSCADPQFTDVELVDDVYSLLAIAVDAAGNISTRSVTFSVSTEPEIDGEETPDASLELPNSISFKVKRGALKSRRYYKAKFTASFTLPPDASRDDCEGVATLQVKRAGSKLGSAKAAFSASGRTCTASGTIKIAKKLRGKKLTAQLGYSSGPFKPATLTGKPLKF